MKSNESYDIASGGPRLSRFLLIAAAVLGLISPLFGQGGAETGTEGMTNVREIVFVGNYTFSDKELAKKIGFSVGDYLDPILAETGRRTIMDYYQKKGFPYAKVTLNSVALSEGKVIYIIEQGPRVRIRSITFKGNEKIETGDLRAAIDTKTRSWLVRPVYYNKEKIDRDVEKLRKIYYREGFLDHRIKVLGESHITFVIEEGPQYRVGQIKVDGNEEFDDATLMEGLELETGDVYHRQKAESQVKRVLKRYRESGFIDAHVEQHPEYTGGVRNDVVNLVFEVSEGLQFRIGRVDITGNINTQDRVIRRILDEYDFTPGKLYDAHMAPPEGDGTLEQYVRRMTLADQVLIRPAASDEPVGDRKDVSVDVQEGLTGMWNPGIGFGSDSGFIGRLVYQQRNFDITDTPETLGDFFSMNSFRGAGQTLRVALEPGTRVSQYSVAFTEPYFNDKPTSLDVVGTSYERWRRSHDENRLRGLLGFEQRLEDDWRRSIAFRAENVDIDSIDLDAPQEIYDVEGSNYMYGVKVGTGRNVTDNRYLPTTGYTFDTSYEQVTGDKTFGILTGGYVRYTTLHEDLLERKTVLATKIRAGTTVGDAPPFEKFYAGGTGIHGIRGFEYYGVSPRGLQTNVASPERKDPIGSDWIFLASGEVTVPLVGESLSGLFFIDSGTVETGGYRASVGTGLQIMIPQWFGPVPMRFEVAFPFLKDGEDETQAFSFSMGGHLF
mgnify:CR=1 FL=1